MGVPLPSSIKMHSTHMRFHHMSFVLIPIPKAPGPTWQLTLKVRLLYREFFHLPVRKFVTRFCYYLLSFLAGEAGILWFMSAVRLDNLFLQVLANGTAAVALSIPFCVLVFLNTEEFRYALGLVRARLPFGKGRKQ